MDGGLKGKHFLLMVSWKSATFSLRPFLSQLVNAIALYLKMKRFEQLVYITKVQGSEGWLIITRGGIMIKNYGISTTAGGGVLGRLHSSTPSPSPSPTRRSRVGLGLGRGVLELKLYEVPTTDSSQVR